MTEQEGTNDAPVPPTMDEIKEEYIYGTIDRVTGRIFEMDCVLCSGTFEKIPD